MGTFRQLTPTVPPLKSMKERSEYRVPRPPTRSMAHEEMRNTDKGNLGRRDMRDRRPAAFRIHPKHPGFAEPYGVQVLSPSGNRDSRLSRVRQVGATIGVQDRGRAPKIVRIDLTVVAHARKTARIGTGHATNEAGDGAARTLERDISNHASNNTVWSA
jgi:hypothetical protein